MSTDKRWLFIGNAKFCFAQGDTILPLACSRLKIKEKMLALAGGGENISIPLEMQAIEWYTLFIPFRGNSAGGSAAV